MLNQEAVDVQLALVAMYNAIRLPSQPEMQVKDVPYYLVLPMEKAAELARTFPRPPNLDGNYWDRIDSDPIMRETYEFIKRHAIRKEW